MKRAVIGGICCLLLSGCVTTTATRLGTSMLHPPLMSSDVAIHRTAAQVPGTYEEVALLYAKGPATMTNEPQMFESMKAKAAEALRTIRPTRVH
jgi:hypothetical protein